MKVKSVGHNFNLANLGIVIAFRASSFIPVRAENSDDEYIPEIGWSSRITSMGLDEAENIGEKYKFECQPASEDLIHAPVWGTKVYTTNSGICSTAVHSGMLDPEEGGIVTIKLIEGKKFYTGSKKNNVTSEDRSSTNLAFTFVGKKKIVANNLDNSDDKTDKKKRQPSGIERVLMDGFTRGVERSIEKAISDVFE